MKKDPIGIKIYSHNIRFTCSHVDWISTCPGEPRAELRSEMQAENTMLMMKVKDLMEMPKDAKKMQYLV